MAGAGDWLLVRGRTDSTHDRRGHILQARGPHGGPPYLVHWVDTDVQALVFPGPDGHVMTEAQMAELDRRQNQRIGQVQQEISAAQHAAAPPA